MRFNAFPRFPEFLGYGLLDMELNSNCLFSNRAIIYFLKNKFGLFQVILPRVNVFTLYITKMDILY